MSRNLHKVPMPKLCDLVKLFFLLGKKWKKKSNIPNIHQAKQQIKKEFY